MIAAAVRLAVAVIAGAAGGMLMIAALRWHGRRMRRTPRPDDTDSAGDYGVPADGYRIARASSAIH